MKIPYHAELRFVNRFLLAASVADLVVVELLVPWPNVRWTLLVLGVACLLWVLIYIRSLRLHPHEIDGTALRLRFSWSTDIWVPLHRIASVRREWRGDHSRTVELDDDTLSLTVSNTTTVHLSLTEPTVLQGHEVRHVRFFADDPDRAVQLLRTEASSRSA